MRHPYFTLWYVNPPQTLLVLVGCLYEARLLAENVFYNYKHELKAEHARFHLRFSALATCRRKIVRLTKEQTYIPNTSQPENIYSTADGPCCQYILLKTIYQGSARARAPPTTETPMRLQIDSRYLSPWPALLYP